MRVIINEFIKVYVNKNILLVFAGLLLLNALLLYIYANDQRNYYSPDAYRQIYSSVENLSNEEALEKIKDEYEELNFFLELSLMSSDWTITEESLRETYRSLDITNLIDKFNRGDFLKYTDNLWAEKYLYSHIIEEIENVVYYDDYLEKVDAEANIMQSVSIFAQPNTFPYRNITKTSEDFKHLKGNELTVAPSNGVMMATQFLVTDIIAIILIMTVVIQLIIREKEQQQLSLIKTTYKGRLTLAVSKLCVVIISCFLILLLLYSINFIMAYAIYGFGDISRYIQSIKGYLGSSLAISVFQYFVLFLIAKLFVYILFALIFFTVSIIARSSMMVYVSLALLLGMSAILYLTIPPSSVLDFFKYINLIHFLQTYTLFSNYLNLNIFGYPLQYIYCFIIVTLTLIIILSVISIIKFSQQRHVDTPLKTTAYIHEKINKLSWFKGHVSLFRHELYKILIVNKVLFMLLVFMIFQIITYQPLSERFADYNEIYYKQYMLELEGENSQIKEEFLASEQQRFAELEDELSLLIQSGDHSLKITQLFEQLAPQEAFNMVLERKDYLRSLAEDDHLNGWFLYDIGYQKLTAAHDNTKDFQLALLLMIVLIACLAPIFTYETQTGMIQIVLPTQHGRRKAFYAKLLLSLMIAIFIYVIVYAPEFINVLKAYGTQAIHAPIYSMPHMNNMKIEISILQYLCLISIVRFIGVLLAMLLVFFTSVKLSGLISVYLTATGVLILPLLLSLLNIHLFDYLLLNPLLAGNILFKESSFSFLQNNRIFWYMILFIVVILAFWILYHDFKKTYIRYTK